MFSLSPKVDDDGVTFRSTYDGDEYRLTPEGAVDVQTALGCRHPDGPRPVPAAAQPAGDGPRGPGANRARGPAGPDGVPAPSRTRPGYQFGIVQGGVDHAMRAESAERTVDIGFDGYGIGGLSVGESRDEMLPALAAAIERLPADRPRYLMGLGDPVGIVEAIALGVDMFDCVLPTRFGRHGTLLTSEGRLNIKNRRFADDAGPLDPTCACPVCARYSRAYLRHLANVNEPTAARLATIHNLAWTLRLTERARAAVSRGTLDALRAEVASVHE